jgi:carbohydrate-selective porin OprB
LKLSTEDSTWFAAADAWQYLWVEGGSSQPVDINNGRQDLQGVGVFSRVQFADKDTNPVDYILSAGVSAKGLIPGRDNDSMGLGYSYSKLQLGRFLTAIGIEDTSTAVELFYNIELTPAVHLNLDAQLTNSALPNIDTATILGASLQIRL